MDREHLSSLAAPRGVRTAQEQRHGEHGCSPGRHVNRTPLAGADAGLAKDSHPLSRLVVTQKSPAGRSALPIPTSPTLSSVSGH